MDPDDVAEISVALEESDRVDHSRIAVEAADDAIVLRGAVATTDAAHVAEIIASEYTDNVINELRIDRGLREGTAEATPGEAASPRDDEVLVGATDMLAGPEAEITSDMSTALEENQPWDPPDEPSLAPSVPEYGGDVSFGDGGPIENEDVATDEADRAEYSAADLSKEELEAAARGATVPSLPPEDLGAPEAEPHPLGVDDSTVYPPEKADDWPSRVPGASGGVGAVGEVDQAGGSVGGTPATETGSVGADTRNADPVRSATGGSMTDSGTSRGPESRDDAAVREDFPKTE